MNAKTLLAISCRGLHVFGQRDLIPLRSVEGDAIKFRSGAKVGVVDAMNTDVIFAKSLLVNRQLSLETTVFSLMVTRPPADSVLVSCAHPDIDDLVVVWVCESINAVLPASFFVFLFFYKLTDLVWGLRKEAVDFLLDL